MKRFVYLLPVFFILLASCESKQSVDFRVIDGKTKQPINNARITLSDGTTAYTNYDGECSIDCSIKSSYKVKVSKRGYETSNKSVKVFAGVAEEISLYEKLNTAKRSERRWETGKPFSGGELIDFPDVEAEFPGGAAEMSRFINANVVYPEEAIENEEQGKVYVSFVVTKDGSIEGIQVERGVSPSLDNAAVEVLARMPKWNPGKAAGRNVNTRCRLPIVFTLQ